MKRLNDKQLKEKYEEYFNYFKGDKKQIAYEMAKDFIYQAQLDFEHYLNNNYSKYDGDTFRARGDLREQAINETAEYLKN